MSRYVFHPDQGGPRGQQCDPRVPQRLPHLHRLRSRSGVLPLHIQPSGGNFHLSHKTITFSFQQLLGEDGTSILNHNAKTHTAHLKQWERDCFSCNITQAVPMTAWVIPSSQQFFELSLVDTQHRLFWCYPIILFLRFKDFPFSIVAREENLEMDPCTEDPAYSFQEMK